MRKKIIILILSIIVITVLIFSIVNIVKINVETEKNDHSNISAIILGNTEKKEVDKSKKEKIKDYKYSLYFYDIENIEYEYKGEIFNLKEALKNEELLIEQVIAQAEEDAKTGKIYMTIASDGGSKLYIYDNFSILKMHSANGNRDVYIGKPNMRMSGVE